MSNAIASIGINIIFGLWLGPLSIFYIRGFPDYLDHKIGQMTIFFYYINVYTHVSKATCVAGISDMIMLTFGYAISPHMDIKWGNFLTTTMEWQLYHTADGIIMSIFATKWFHKRMPKQQQPSVKTTTNTPKNEIPNRIFAFNNNTQSLNSRK
uniref:7TM GPCR serpentine receptor class x (Srx) domain-containing protein n=1 Tax=Acrobeloides nanus TaxID=290746 RepID=A0A914E3R5_9BILA